MEPITKPVLDVLESGKDQMSNMLLGSLESCKDKIGTMIMGGLESSKDAIASWCQSMIGNLLKGILLGIINNSYWICLLICLIAFLLYLCGCKKAAKYSTLSIVAYFILKAIKEVL